MQTSPKRRSIAPRITLRGYRRPSVDELEARDAAPGHTDPASLLHVMVDAQLTRRKFYHTVVNHAGELLWRDRLFGALVEWLHNDGWLEYFLHTENRIFRVRMEVVSEDKGD